MSAILTKLAKWDAGLDADIDVAVKLQRPLPADPLRVVAQDQRQGGVAVASQGQLALNG
jgi:hypothetical protein